MQPASAGEPVLDARDLRKSYREGGREHVVLAGATLSVRSGEAVALRGPSGSGKSTLLNLIGGLDVPDSGSIRVAGVELTALGERQRTLLRRTRLGFVFQFFNLIPTLTVLENVQLPLELAGAGRDAGARASALLADVGLADRGDAYPDVLSGGEQQRVAVARALVHAPQLLLADEPTGSLDEASGRQVLDLLDRLRRRAGNALLVVTHNDEVVRRADRVLRLHDGRIET